MVISNASNNIQTNICIHEASKLFVNIMQPASNEFSPVAYSECHKSKLLLKHQLLQSIFSTHFTSTMHKALLTLNHTLYIFLVIYIFNYLSIFNYIM